MYHQVKSLNAGQEVIHEVDVVSIHDSNLKKGFWKLGIVKITDTRKGSRSAWSRSENSSKG